jgi:hypothetical protein
MSWCLRCSSLPACPPLPSWSRCLPLPSWARARCVVPAVRAPPVLRSIVCPLACRWAPGSDNALPGTSLFSAELVAASSTDRCWSKCIGRTPSAALAAACGVVSWPGARSSVPVVCLVVVCLVVIASISVPIRISSSKLDSMSMVGVGRCPRSSMMIRGSRSRSNSPSSLCPHRSGITLSRLGLDDLVVPLREVAAAVAGEFSTPSWTLRAGCIIIPDGGRVGFGDGGLSCQCASP